MYVNNSFVRIRLQLTARKKPKAEKKPKKIKREASEDDEDDYDKPKKKKIKNEKVKFFNWVNGFEREQGLMG